MALLGIFAVSSAVATSTTLEHDAISIAFQDDLSLLVSFTGGSSSTTTSTNSRNDAVALPPAVFVEGKMRELNGGGLLCNAGGAIVHGTDVYGQYDALNLNCTVDGKTKTLVNYSVKKYPVPGYERDVLVIFDVSFPNGAQGTQMRAVQVESRSPPQFAPFPAFNLDVRATRVACLLYNNYAIESRGQCCRGV